MQRKRFVSTSFRRNGAVSGTFSGRDKKSLAFCVFVAVLLLYMYDTVAALLFKLLCR